MPLKLSRGFCPPRPLGEQPVAGPRVYPPEEGTLRRSRSPLRETWGSFLPSPGSGEEKTAPAGSRLCWYADPWRRLTAVSGESVIPSEVRGGERSRSGAVPEHRDF